VQEPVVTFTLVQRNHHAPAELPRILYDPALDFVHPKLIKAYAYWRERCGSRPLPQRSDLDPVAMRGFISHVGLFEVRKEGDGSIDYFVRLAGGRIDDVFGWRGGRPLTDDLPPEIARRWREPLDRVIETGRPIRARSRIAYENKIWMDGEMFYAPLGECATAPAMIFFAFAVLSATHEADKN
jgi:hypothetical protein